MLGMSTSTFTSVHVALSLVGIASGVLALPGWLGSRNAARLTALFLLTTVAASVTGFLFPSTRVGVGHVIGVVSLVVLAPTLLALYCYRLAGPWRWIYVGGATTALYLNVFIGVLQAFAKVAFLHALAPTPFAPPVLAAQLSTLAICAALGALATRHSLTRYPRADMTIHRLCRRTGDERGQGSKRATQGHRRHPVGGTVARG